jgi:hypothetical protein
MPGPTPDAPSPSAGHTAQGSFRQRIELLDGREAWLDIPRPCTPMDLQFIKRKMDELLDLLREFGRA